MKGIALYVPDGKIVKAVRSTIIISNKEGNPRLLFTGNGEGNPNISHTWYSRDLRPGDKFRIRHCDIDGAKLSVPEYTVDYDNPDVNGNEKCTDFGNRECSDIGNSNAPISVTTIHNFR